MGICDFFKRTTKSNISIEERNRRRDELFKYALEGYNSAVLNNMESYNIKFTDDYMIDVYNNSLLHIAVACQNYELTFKLLNTVDDQHLIVSALKKKNKFGSTPYRIAIELQNENIIKLLVLHKESNLEDQLNELKDKHQNVVSLYRNVEKDTENKVRKIQMVAEEELSRYIDEAHKIIDGKDEEINQLNNENMQLKSECKTLDSTCQILNETLKTNKRKRSNDEDDLNKERENNKKLKQENDKLTNVVTNLTYDNKLLTQTIKDMNGKRKK